MTCDVTRTCCFKNQVVTPCYRWCEEKTCANLANPQNCSTACESNVCVCAGDLYRNECNECVPKERCSEKCKRTVAPLDCADPNEVLNTCWNPTKVKVCPDVAHSKLRDRFLEFGQSSAPGLCILSVCDCKDGYLRNRCGLCVPEKQCSDKCCIDECDPCPQQNEVRVTKHRKRSHSSKRSHSPFSCKRKHKKHGHDEKSVCVCKKGFVRDKCGRCVQPDQLNLFEPCLCTNPCSLTNKINLEWQCFNECNIPYCYNYWELEVWKNKTCPTECVWGCNCPKNLWFNGTHCVPGEQCKPYAEIVEVEKAAFNATTLVGLATYTSGLAAALYAKAGRCDLYDEL